jgi:hypothetical protein
MKKPKHHLQSWFLGNNYGCLVEVDKNSHKLKDPSDYVVRLHEDISRIEPVPVLHYSSSSPKHLVFKDSEDCIYV